jgi:hypothetical protein
VKKFITFADSTDFSYRYCQKTHCQDKTKKYKYSKYNMRILEKLLTLERLHKLIKNQYNGSAEDYAKKLNISRATLFNYLDELTFFGAKITYKRTLNCFVYLNEFVLKITIETDLLDDEEMKKIAGGTNFFIPSIFLDGTTLSLQNKFGVPTPNIKDWLIKKIFMQKQLTKEEMAKIHGGWKFFGKEDHAIAGSECKSDQDCSQMYQTVIYVFGIPIKKKEETLGGCSYSTDPQKYCANCTAKSCGK